MKKRLFNANLANNKFLPMVIEMETKILDNKDISIKYFVYKIIKFIKENFYFFE